MYLRDQIYYNEKALQHKINPPKLWFGCGSQFSFAVKLHFISALIKIYIRTASPDPPSGHATHSTHNLPINQLELKTEVVLWKRTSNALLKYTVLSVHKRPVPYSSIFQTVRTQKRLVFVLIITSQSHHLGRHSHVKEPHVSRDADIWDMTVVFIYPSRSLWAGGNISFPCFLTCPN